MDSREMLKSMLNSVINDDTDTASLDLHNYLAIKMREVSGIANSPVSVEEDVEEEEWDLLSESTVGSFSKKIQKSVVDWAQQGSRVVADGKTIWAGTALIGDNDLTAEINYQWEQKGERFTKKLSTLKADKIEIFNGYSAAGKKVWGAGKVYHAAVTGE